MKVGVGARASGIGAFSALADDVSSLYWNPAGLAKAGKSLEASHAEWISGIRHDFAGYSHPLAGGILAVGGLIVDYPLMEGRDQAALRTGDFSASDMAASVGYGRNLSRVFRAGGAVKYIRSDLADAEAATWAMDFGGQWDIPAFKSAGMKAALAIRNLGPGLRFERETAALPLTVTAGASLQPLDHVRLGLDVDHRVREESWRVGAGMELTVFSRISLRGGYSGQALGQGGSFRPAQDGWQGLRFGMGFRWGAGTRLDYAAAPMGELGLTHWASIQTRFK